MLIETELYGAGKIAQKIRQFASRKHENLSSIHRTYVKGKAGNGNGGMLIIPVLGQADLWGLLARQPSTISEF